MIVEDFLRIDKSSLIRRTWRRGYEVSRSYRCFRKYDTRVDVRRTSYIAIGTDNHAHQSKSKTPMNSAIHSTEYTVRPHVNLASERGSSGGSKSSEVD